MIVLRYDGPAGTRLDNFLLQNFPSLSPGTLHKYLRQNKIKLNGKKHPLTTRLAPGDELRLYLPDEAPHPPSLRVLYEDDLLLAVEKPPGIPCESNISSDNSDSMLELAKKHLKGTNNNNSSVVFTDNKSSEHIPMLCHRLDTGTGGVLLFAKDPDFLKWVEEQMRQKRFIKKYLCITVGIPSPRAGTLDGFLTKDASKGQVRISAQKAPGAKSVTTRYKVLASSGRLGLLDVELITGRTHQIRAHLASIGTPILGDSKYGVNDINRKMRCKYQCLFASEITFPKLDFDSPYASYSGLRIEAGDPWYVQQLCSGELHLD